MAPPAGQHVVGRGAAPHAVRCAEREIRFTMTANDFEGLPGLYAWLGRVGLPGWVAAWLTPITPELGSAILMAHRRTLRQRKKRPANLATA